MILKSFLFSFIAAAGLSSMSQAAVPLRSATVKVTSSYADGSVIYRGSGLEFENGGGDYVLTSDHVVLHDNRRKECFVNRADGSKLACQFVAADYGRGIALLKITGGALSQYHFSDLKIASPAAGSRAIMMGYPGMATGLVRDTAGTVASAKMPSSVLPQVPEMLEITGGHAEFGMSGGIVTDHSDSFLGVLAFQVYEDDTIGHMSDTILVVPGDVVLNWLSEYFANPNDPPVELTQTTEQMAYKEMPSLSSGTLGFSYLDAFGKGEKLFAITPLSQPATTRMIGDNPELKNFATYLAAHDDCVMYLTSFKARDGSRSLGLPA